MATVGVIGAGLMGTACARRLMQAGFDVLAYDVEEAKRAAIAKLGARTAESVAATVGQSDAIVLAVFLDLKARREEAWLQERLDGYDDYRTRTPRKLVPFFY